MTYLAQLNFILKILHAMQFVAVWKRIAMKIILTAIFVCFCVISKAQPFCFYDPNTGPLYHNGTSGGIYDITCGDFNGDNHLDIVTANSTANSISFVPGYGNGTLGSPDTINVPGVLYCMTSGDFNSDGFLDVATANTANIFVLMGNGNGTFQPFVSYPTPGSSSRLYCKYLNADSIPDLVEATTNGVFVLIGQSNGAFMSAVNYATGGSVIDVSIADFDNDSILDLATTTNVTWTYSYLTFHKGVGNGTFGPPTIINVPHHSIFGINSFDINSDGNVDLIVSNINNMIHRIEVYTGNGDGTFNSPLFYPASYNPNYVYLADMNNDNYTDVIVPEGSGYSLLGGNSNGTLNTFQNFVAAASPNSLCIGDFNEDGKKDFINPTGYFGLGIITVNLNCLFLGMENIPGIKDEAITIFPNPFHSHSIITCKVMLQNATLHIYTYAGVRVHTIVNISQKEIILERKNLSPGFYFYMLQDNSHVFTGNFVIED